MNILLFSDDRILYRDGDKSAVCSILVPRYSKIKKYADIASPTDNSVKLRHGDADDLPTLWRQEGPYVYVYGNISQELDEMRHTNHIYLPQDFVGEDVGAFYFVFGGRFVIHGVKTITDDGQQVWGTSLVGEKGDMVADIVVSSISERMLEGRDEKVVVAIHNDEELLENFREALKPFEQDVVAFETLGQPSKTVKPLFVRKDRSFIMLTLSLCVFLALSGMVFLWVSGQVELQAQETKSQKLYDAIRNMKKNKVLGYIKNPKEILILMNNTLPLPPSTLVHNTGEVGAMFGDLVSVELGNANLKTSRRGRQTKARTAKNIFEASFKVEIPESTLLLEQERIAQKAIETMPWIKYIERPEGGSRQVKLKVGMQAK